MSRRAEDEQENHSDGWKYSLQTSIKCPVRVALYTRGHVIIHTHRDLSPYQADVLPLFTEEATDVRHGLLLEGSSLSSGNVFAQALLLCMANNQERKAKYHPDNSYPRNGPSVIKGPGLVLL